MTVLVNKRNLIGERLYIFQDLCPVDKRRNTESYADLNRCLNDSEKDLTTLKFCVVQSRRIPKIPRKDLLCPLRQKERIQQNNCERNFSNAIKLCDMAITETWLSSYMLDDTFRLTGYTCFCIDPSHTEGKVIPYIKSYITTK